jgi:hypothetical protein
MKTEFRTPAAVFRGEQIVLNCRTKQAGLIRVQVRAGGSKIGQAAGMPVAIGLRLEMAELFSLRFQ